jgi:putative hydrolase of the HAD superfamily
VRDMGYESKPDTSAYRRICELLGVRPEECLLVEDNVRNLRPAKALGMTTVLVNSRSNSVDDSVDYSIPCVEEVEKVLTNLATGT